jgi:hypothetical protein
MMEPLVRQLGVRSAVDVGANIGWFVFAFDRLGIPAIGVERESRALRIALYARARTPHRSQAGFLALPLDRASAQFVPPADCVVFLSVWHHLVRDFGLPDATAILGTLWEKTAKVLFFETGESEMPEAWGLPAMEPTPREWLERYLAESCPGSRVVALGEHDAGLGAPGQVMRTLLAVVRTG